MSTPHDNLERIVDQALRSLPVPRAPRSLLPRIMAAAAESRRPWYARAWRTWPVAWQIASVSACLVLLAAASFSMPVVQNALMAKAGGVGGQLSGTQVWHLVGRVADVQRAAEVVWRVVIGPLATLALGPVLVMLAASLAFAAALGRLAFEGTTQS